jgi:glycosyltransferase involved in cell wall biosynthesis
MRTTLGGSNHNRLLKILHIDPARDWGGGEAQVLGLLDYLAAKGHENVLLTHPQGRLWERCQGLNVRTLPFVARNDVDVRPIWRLRQLIRRHSYDIVHLHTKRAHALSMWLPRRQPAPKYVVTRRMDYPEVNNRYTRLLYNRCVDGVVVISRPIVQLLINAGVDARRIRLIHSGVDVTRFTSRICHGRSVRPPVIGCVAGLEERKGHRFLLEALALLKAQGVRVRCVLAGEGSERPALEKMTARLRLERDVEFPGFIADTPAFLADIDVFVLPSLYEGLGVAALEAMAAGKPVVASEVGGLAELIEDGTTGLLTPPRNVQALSAAIARLIDDPSLARSLGQRASEHVREHFAVEQMAARNEAYYYELLEAGA